jgi:DNA mismatch repair protein MutL
MVCEVAMEAKIRLLPPDVASKIAAGEVIERPASVVKELVENSLDAGGRTITVEIEDGGKQRIAVLDDGEGMGREDALLAVERHATSKLIDEGGLASVTSLGFRGEALPSIAAVSRLRLTTRTRGELAGTQVLVEGGQVKGVEEIGTPPGTRVEVIDLFYNLPARQKFLRGAQGELAHIIEVITRMALAYTAVGFVLKHNKRVVFNLPPTTDELSRVRAVLGKEIASQVVRVDPQQEDGTIRGWASIPTYCRGSAKGIYFYVNGRYIRDKLISHAVSEAYRRFIPSKMYPVVILYLAIPPADVDVNVHPTKMEVRFRRGEAIHRLVSEALKGALSHPTEQVGAFETGEIRETTAPYSVQASIPWDAKPCLPTPWRVAGLLKGTYVVLEGEEGVMIFDQHALHERILYEQLKRQLPGEQSAKQPFLIPQPVEMTREEKELLIGYRAELAAVGLEVEEFGERAVAVHAIPSFLHGEDVSILLQTLSEALADRGAGGAVEDIRERIRVFLACRGAVKANRRLQDEEVRSLVRDWEGFGRPTTCPHGRPLMILWPWRDFAGWFKRD